MNQKNRRKYIYIDMQAISEREIGSGGLWRDYLLISWGLVYRVIRKCSLYKSGAYHLDR